MKIFTTVLPVLFLILFACRAKENTQKPVNDKVHVFYYGWFGNPDVDGNYHQWNHRIIPHWRDTTWDHAENFKGGDDIGANFYPRLGCYSSNDEEIISTHMEWIREAGIGVLAISWWGKNTYTDKSVPTYLELAQKHGLKLAFHIEPVYKTPGQFREMLDYINSSYGNHPAVFKHQGKLFYYLYDSGKVKYHEWSKLLHENGEMSIRNSSLDAVFIGHWERERDGGFILKSGFDGFYTYYASEGFMYGSTSKNWGSLSEFAKQNDLLFIPCPGPGYLDTRIRPWNGRNTEDREGGRYYENMFLNAIHAGPDYIGITSFNEWHEGTQIEPAIPLQIPSFTYEDYGAETDPMFYIRKTRELIDQFESGTNE